MPFLDLVRWKISTKYQFRTILLPDGRFQKGWGSLDNDIDVEPNDKLHISFHQSTDVTDSTSDNAVSAQYNAGDGTQFNLAYFSTGINRLLVRQKGIQLGGLQRLWSDQVRLEFSSNYDFTQQGLRHQPGGPRLRPALRGRIAALLPRGHPGPRAPSPRRTGWTW